MQGGGILRIAHETDCSRHLQIVASDQNRANLVAPITGSGLMLVLTLKRTKAPLDRDVIFLAESGEEGMREVGAQFMIDRHFAAIDAEYLPCGRRRGGAQRRQVHAVEVAEWTPLRVNETGSYFRKLEGGAITPEAAKRYQDLLSPNPKISRPAADWMLEHEPSTGRCYTLRSFRPS